MIWTENGIASERFNLTTIAMIPHFPHADCDEFQQILSVSSRWLHTLSKYSKNFTYVVQSENLVTWTETQITIANANMDVTLTE